MPSGDMFSKMPSHVGVPLSFRTVFRAVLSRLRDLPETHTSRSRTLEDQVTKHANHGQVQNMSKKRVDFANQFPYRTLNISVPQPDPPSHHL